MKGMAMTPLGIALTHGMVIVLEALWLAPKGATGIHSCLIKGARGLTASGKLGIFTPMLFFKARRPLDGGAGPAAAVASPAKRPVGRPRGSKSKSPARKAI